MQQPSKQFKGISIPNLKYLALNIQKQITEYHSDTKVDIKHYKQEELDKINEELKVRAQYV